MVDEDKAHRRVWYECDRVIGVDLGAGALHVVALSMVRDPRPVVLDVATFDPATEREAFEAFCASPHIAIDAPDKLSSGPHVGDTRLSLKFQTARCAEIALALQHRMWVPWVTPTSEHSSPAWMKVGFEAWRWLREIGEEPIEVYPHAVFWRLAGRPLNKKATVTGARQRIQALSSHVCLPRHIPAWSHDATDALAAALVAWQAAHNLTERVTCAADDPWPRHDGSTIHLPSAEWNLGGDPVPAERPT